MTITTNQRYYLQIQVLAEVLAEITTEIIAEIAAEIAGRTELNLNYSSGDP